MYGMQLAAPCVLIVSDAEDRSQALRRQVESLGAQIHVLPDCRAVIEQTRANDVALILLDLQLPMLDGLEAVRLLRHAPRAAHVPVIMISDGRMGLADRQRGQAFGAVTYLQRQELDFDALQQQMRLLLDLLTGLPNRMFFDLHLSGLIRRGARGGRGFALVWIDLDHLSRVNQRHQREAGDQMLLTVAQRLESVVRSSDVLARIEGDTYGLILDGVVTTEAAQLALSKVLAIAGEPLELKTGAEAVVTLIPTLSVGVALYPRHGEDQNMLLNVAQLAAQDVLRAGGDGVRIGWATAQTSEPLAKRR